VELTPSRVRDYHSRMRVALVHDWLTGMRGGERVLEELCELFPHATLFTLFHARGSVTPRIEAMPIRTSFLDRLPGAARHYRYLLPLYPWAVSRFDLRGFDLIISNSHAAAKGIRKPPGSIHICYCLTPMRYIWDMQEQYFHYSDPLGLRRAALKAMTTPLRAWDVATAARVDQFIADSRHVQDRISRCYGRSAELIYPPVETNFFTPDQDADGVPGFYLIVSALVPYKRLDLAVDAFNELGRSLIVVGSGPDLELLRKRARSNIEFRGFVPKDELRMLYRKCRALVIPGQEDFGLASLEAQACGRPAVAYGAGGSLESVIDEVTGVLFGRQTTDALVEAVRRLERIRFNPGKLRANAERFSAERFRQSMRAMVEKAQNSSKGKAVFALRPAQSPRHPHPSLSGLSGLLKRSLDISVSLLGLAILGLPILLTALAIRLGSPGPGFFFQPRVGLGGQSFDMVKLRTMREDAERDEGPTWAVKDDPRCTQIGGWLRRYGVDELPQLWNVLKGEMSLVGPRPERPEFHRIFEAEMPEFARRLVVRGGLTGLAQIRGWRGDTSVEERLRSDLEYIETWSLAKDLWIIVRTASFRPSR
jgi:lipopolysaccharide/colanic/teichoic acid biosynthesis glycosyltransferase/glycosyltransferase involved in cell wall biosynthesis